MNLRNEQGKGAGENDYARCGNILFWSRFLDLAAAYTLLFERGVYDVPGCFLSSEWFAATDFIQRTLLKKYYFVLRKLHNNIYNLLRGMHIFL